VASPGARETTFDLFLEKLKIIFHPKFLEAKGLASTNISIPWFLI
jgi:hypothetical protein